MAVTRSKLVELLAARVTNLSYRDMDAVVRLIVEQCAMSLERGERIEIRGFGTFSLHYHPPHLGMNPATGERVHVGPKTAVHFNVGQALRKLVAKPEVRRAGGSSSARDKPTRR